MYENLIKVDQLFYELEEQLAIYVQPLAEYNADASPRLGSRLIASSSDRDGSAGLSRQKESPT
jgi:hypothetical protein